MIAPRRLVKMCHETPHKCMIINSGGGVDIHSWLLVYGGGSSTYLDGAIPHGRKSPSHWLKHVPKRAVLPEVATGYAMAAYQHALKMREYPEQPVFGVGATIVASLAVNETEREGREHRIYAALQTRDFTKLVNYKCPEGLTRLEEEDIYSRILLNLVAEGCEIKENCFESTEIEFQYASSKDCFSENSLPILLSRENDRPICFSLNGEYPVQQDYRKPKLIFSSSFNPRHQAHIEMQKIAQKTTNQQCDLELPLINANKNPLTYIDLRNRLQQFKNDGSHSLYLSNYSTFIDKAKEYSCDFVVGYDTLVRIADPKFYASESHRDWVFHEFKNLKTKFVVFGRIDPETQKFMNYNTHKTGHKIADDYFDHYAIVIREKQFSLDFRSSTMRSA